LEKKEGIVIGATAGLVMYTLALTLLGPAISAAVANRTVANTGSIKTVGVGVYSDQAATSPLSSINWGTLDPGSNVNKTVYIRNEGTAAATLSMSTSNWSPSNAATYMTLSWNYNGQTVNVNQVVQVKFTLAVSSSVSGITNFSFDITITATG
jgi:hypothetical protein